MPIAARSFATHRTVILAGLAGSMAEVVWVALYSAFSSVRSDEVLRQITASILPAFGEMPLAPAFGLVMHFALGVLVAYAFGILVWHAFTRRTGAGATLCAAVLALVAIWSLIFFVLLPVVNVQFTALMPYSVTLASKILFGVAMAGVLNSPLAKKSIELVARSHAHA